MRAFLTPSLLLLAALGLHLYNARADGEVLAFSFMPTVLPATAGDPVAMGAASVKLLAGLGLVLALSAAWRARGTHDD